MTVTERRVVGLEAEPVDVDLVNISIKATLLPKIIEECGQKGVKFLIVHSAGFKEVGEEGIKREREMVELAHSLGMRLFGPNSQGVQNSDPGVSAYANFTFVPMKPGNISIIAQGGGMGELMKLHLHNVGLGHRLYCSYGNEADLTMPELLEYYCELLEAYYDLMDDRFRIKPSPSLRRTKMAVNIFGSVTESADTRSWLTIPEHINLARLTLPAGTYDLKVDLLGHRGEVLSTQTVPGVAVVAGDWTFLSRRVF